MARRQVDFYQLARRQRWLIWMILGVILAQVMAYSGAFATSVPLMLIMMIVVLGLSVAVLIGIVLVMVAQGDHPAVITLAGIFMLAPCINLLILLMVNRTATRSLQSIGLRVGLMGVNPEDARRMADGSLCNHCGYNLTGNLSGVCPECGQATRSSGLPAGAGVEGQVGADSGR